MTDQQKKEGRDPGCSRCSAMHRRAQRLEGIEQHEAKLRRGFAAEIATARANGHWRVRVYRQHYRDAAEQLVAAGVPDHVDGYPTHRQRRLDVLIGRLVAERDRLRACIDDMISYLAHADQDADHRWMVEQMRKARDGR